MEVDEARVILRGQKRGYTGKWRERSSDLLQYL